MRSWSSRYVLNRKYKTNMINIFTVCLLFSFYFLSIPSPAQNTTVIPSTFYEKMEL